MKKTKEQRCKFNMKSNKGITLVSLVITIAVMMIIASVTVNTSMGRFEMNSYKKLMNDLELLQEKVESYYLKYGGLPILRDSDNNPITPTTNLDFDKNEKDNSNYYIIDLEAMENLVLNYGKGFENYTDPNEKDLYIINEGSHMIYYVKGVELSENIYYCVENDNEMITDNIPPTKPEIKIISGEKNEEGFYTSDVEIEIIPGKDNGSGIEKTTYSYVFIDINNIETYVSEEIQESKVITLTQEGEYNIQVTSVDKSNNESNRIEIIKIQKQEMIKLVDMITYDNYGDLIEYEANGVNDWKVFFNDGNNVFIITTKFMPYSSLPSKSKMIKNDKYKMYWEPIYGAPTVGFEYGHAPVVTELTQNSKVLERAEKFQLTWIKEYSDKDWNSARAVKDLLNNDIWNVYAEGLNGAEAIGAPTLEMFAESWKQKGCEEIKYTRSENGYSIGDNGSWFNLANASNGKDISLYIPTQEGASEDEKCVSYWLAAIAINDTHSLLVVDGTNKGIFGDWYNAKYYGIRPVVCLPSNAVATNSDGVWKNLGLDLN